MRTSIRGSRPTRLIVGVSLVLLVWLVAALVRPRLANAPEATVPPAADETAKAEQSLLTSPPVVLPPSREIDADADTKVGAADGTRVPPDEQGKPEPKAGTVSGWFLARAAQARKDGAMAGINEAKATLSVGFAKAYISRSNAGGDVQVGVAEVVQSAFGAAVGSGAQVLFGAVVVKLEFEPGKDDIRLTALTFDGKKVEGVAGVWTIPHDNH